MLQEKISLTIANKTKPNRHSDSGNRQANKAAARKARNQKSLRDAWQMLVAGL